MRLPNFISKLLLVLILVPLPVSASEYSTGSGFFITTDGNFVTNFHVIAGADSIVIRDIYGNTFPALIVRADQANDLAILKVSGKFHPIPIENSSIVKRGAAVVAIGFPHVDVQGLEPKVTDGIVSSLTGIQDDPRYFQISAAVQSGNSGGPLLNMSGNVIGLVSAKLGAAKVLNATGDLTQNVNYAIKSNYLLELVNSLPPVKTGLKGANKKKLDDVAAVYSSCENSIGLVLAKNKTVEVTAVPRRDSNPSDSQDDRQAPRENFEEPIQKYDAIGLKVEMYEGYITVIDMAPNVRGTLRIGDQIIGENDSHRIYKIDEYTRLINSPRFITKLNGTQKRAARFQVLRNGKKQFASVLID